MKIVFSALLAVVLGFSFIYLAIGNQPSQLTDEKKEFAGDIAISQLQYSDAIDSYTSMDVTTPSSILKLGICHFMIGDIDSAGIAFSNPQVQSSSLASEAKFFELCTRLTQGYSSDKYLFLDPQMVSFTTNTLEALLNSTNTPPIAIQLVLRELVYYHEISRSIASDNARAAMSTVLSEYLEKVTARRIGNEQINTSIRISLFYANRNFVALLKELNKLPRHLTYDTDPLVAEAFKVVATALYEYDNQVALLSPSVKAQWSPYAATALQYGVEYLRYEPTDHDFAEWLTSDVYVNIFLQTANPRYLIEATRLGRPNYQELNRLSELSKLVLGKQGDRHLFNEDDESLIDTVFQSPHWDKCISYTKLNDDDLQLLADLQSSLLGPSVTPQTESAISDAAYFLGGTLVLGQLTRTTFPTWMLHNQGNLQPRILDHQWLSSVMFGNRMTQVHKMIDSIKIGGSYHRILGGHDIGWLLRNLKQMANIEIAAGQRLGYRRAVQVWLQHMSQDLFGPRGVPAPVLTRTTYLASQAYGKYVLGLSAKKARTFALRTSARTCLTFVKLGKAATGIMLVWTAHDVYDAVREYQSDATLKSLGKDISDAMDYGDMDLACQKMDILLSTDNVRLRRPEKSLAMRITLARMYEMAGSKENAISNIDHVISTISELEVKMQTGDTKASQSDIKKQVSKLDDASRTTELVMIHDSSFLANVSGRALAYEAKLTMLDDYDPHSIATEAIGTYHRAGDKLAHVSKGNEAYNCWSSAVNYYRGARLALLYEHKDATAIADKAINQIIQLKRFSGPVTRPMLNDLEANWCAHIAPHRLKDIQRVDLNSIGLEPDIRFYQLDLHSVTLGKPFIADKQRIRLELIRTTEDDVEQLLLKTDSKIAEIDRECILMNASSFDIHSNDRFFVRIIAEGIRDRILYDSNVDAINQHQGKAGIFEALKSAPGITFRADMRNAKTYIIDPQEVNLSEAAIGRLTGRLGVCEVIVDGRSAALIQTQKSFDTGRDATSGWGIFLGEKKDQGFRILGGDPAVIHVPVDSSVKIILSSSPNILSKFKRLTDLSNWSMLFLYLPAIDKSILLNDITTFEIPYIDGLVDSSKQDTRARLRSSDGDLMNVTIRRIDPLTALGK